MVFAWVFCSPVSELLLTEWTNTWSSAEEYVTECVACKLMKAKPQLCCLKSPFEDQELALATLTQDTCAYIVTDVRKHIWPTDGMLHVW